MKHYEIAKGEIGVKEIVGSKHNPRVLEYYAEVGHSWVKDDETPWCAAFVGWCLEKAGVGSTRALNARSYIKYGKEVKEPIEGDIVVFWRKSKSSVYGHVGFFTGYSDDGDILVLGGNQGNKVSVAEYDKDRLLGFRRPDYPFVPEAVVKTTRELLEEASGRPDFIPELKDVLVDLVKNQRENSTKRK